MTRCLTRRGLCPPQGVRPRLRWTAALHDIFVVAVTELGGLAKAQPAQLLHRMLAVEGVPPLKLSHLKSHLQKCRQVSLGRAKAASVTRSGGGGRSGARSGGSRGGGARAGSADAADGGGGGGTGENGHGEGDDGSGGGGAGGGAGDEGGWGREEQHAEDGLWALVTAGGGGGFDDEAEAEAEAEEEADATGDGTGG